MIGKEQLIQSIHTAFKDTAKPDSPRLFIDSWESSGEFEDAEKELAQIDWQDIPFGTVQKYAGEIVGRLTPKWFHYLLPAFLIRSLENPSETEIMKTVQTYLSHPIFRPRSGRTEEDKKHFNDIILLIDSHQSYAISYYFRHFVTLDPDIAIYDRNRRNQFRKIIQRWDERVQIARAIEADRKKR